MYDEEEEGEYLDDPISLIFNCADAGAVIDLSTSSDDEVDDPRLAPRSSYGNKNFCLPVTFFNISRNVELLKKCKAPSIKLVDCGKNPQKYKDSCNSKQLQSKVITSSELDKQCLYTERKNDVAKDKSLDIEETVKKPDKVLVKDDHVTGKKNVDDKKQETTNRTKFDSLQEVSDRNIVMTTTKNKKTEVDHEKQQALKSKDLSQVDFKRNTGLIGLTISKKDFPKEVTVAKTIDKKINKDKVSNDILNDVSETLKTLGIGFIPLPDKNPEPLKVVNNGSCSEKPSKEVTRPSSDAENQIVKNNEISPTYCSLKIKSSKLLKKALKLKQAKSHQNKEPSKTKHKKNYKNTKEINAKDLKNPVKQNKETSKEKPKKKDKNTIEITKDHKNSVENKAKEQAVPKLNLKRKYTETNVFYIVNNSRKAHCDDILDPNNKTKKPQNPQKRDTADEIETNEADCTRSNSPILPCTTNLNTYSYTKTIARKETKKTANDRKKTGPLSFKAYTDNYLKTLQAIHGIHRYSPFDNIPSKPILGLNQTQINQVNSSTRSCPVALKSHHEPHISSQIGMKVATHSKSATVDQKILQSHNGLAKKDITVNSRMTSEITVNKPKGHEASLSREGYKRDKMQSLPNLQACQNGIVNKNPTLTTILQTSPKTVASLQKVKEAIGPGEGYTHYRPPCPNVTVNKLPVKRLISQANQETALNLQKPDKPSLPSEDYKSRLFSASSNTHSNENLAVNSIPLLKRSILETAPESASNLPNGNEASLPVDSNSAVKRPVCYYSPGYNAMNFKGTPVRPLNTSINPNYGCPIETMVNNRPQAVRNSDPRQNLGRSLRMVGPCLFPPPTTNVVPAGVQMSHNNPGPLLRLPYEHTNVLTHHMPPSWRPAMLQNQYFPPDQSKPWWRPQPENISAPPARFEIPKESILGSDANGELIKKINIVAVPAYKSTPVKNKTKMLEILNKSIEEQIDTVPSSKIEKVINDIRLKNVDVTQTTQSNSCKPCPLSKKIKTNDLLEPMIAQNFAKEIVEQITAKGYSPPILPIPTYQQAFEIMARKEKKMNDVKMYEWFTNKMKHEKNSSMKRNLPKQEKAKKISIDEYKKRINGKEGASESKDSKRKCKIPDVSNKAAVDNSQDLGYDSDSTVILDLNN